MDFHPLLAADVVAFFLVFGVFVVAIVVLAVLTMKWALAKDRPGRDAWKQRHLQARAEAQAPPQPPPPNNNGH